MSKTSKNSHAPKGSTRGKSGNGGADGDGGNGPSNEEKETRHRQGVWFRRAEIALWVLVVGAFAFRFVPGLGGSRAQDEGTAPDFTVSTLAGDRITLSDLRGQVVLVNFWATWCPPCRLEIPGFQRVYDDYKDKGFTVVGLSADQDGPAVVRQFVADKGITYPVAMATREMMRLYGGVDALPESFLLDKTGHVRKMVSGMFSEGILRRELDTLLAEGKGQ